MDEDSEQHYTFTCRIHAMDVRVGGRWRFDLIAPDGTAYDNRVDDLEIVRPDTLATHVRER